MILDWKKYEEKATEAVAEGVVLLENRNNALPLDKEKTIAVFGRIQLDYYKSGTGSGGMVNVSHVVTIPEGLTMRGAKLDQELLGIYQKWTEEHPFDHGASWGGEPWCQEEMPLSEELAESVSKRCETALIVIGRTAGEEMDNSYKEGSYLLTAGEKDMLRITRKYFKKVVVVLNVASIIDMSFVDEFTPDAVLYGWQGGMMGGLGTADVLLGNVSPSGKLTDTIAYRIEDYPSDANFGDQNRDFYCEDIYVGYRYFETFAKEKVRYPFGYGLSYTKFLFDDEALSAGAFIERVDGKADEYVILKEKMRETIGEHGGKEMPKLIASVRVTNVGTVPGKEVAQVYCEAPQGKLGKPARVLCGFAKTKVLNPGESERVTIEIDPYSFASYDDSGVTERPYSYILESGDYYFHVGGSVRETLKPICMKVDGAEVLKQVSSALAPVRPFSRMVNRGGKPSFVTVPFLDTVPNSVKNEDGEGETTVFYKKYEGKRRLEEMPAEIAYTGDVGIKLKDVFDGKNTLEEFIAQLSDEDLSCIIRGEGMGSPKVTAGTASAFGGVSTHLQELGIPCVCCSDGPSGMRLDCGTKAFSLPGGTMLACTWNRVLLTELFAFTGREMAANHVECLLGPGMNIHRHPLNGRNFEYFSEDPFLTGEIAAAQLSGLHREGVTGTIKHFCGNNQETRRHFLDSVISERALREIYLKGFEIAVKKGGAYTVMTTYGSVNGLWTAGSYDLTTTILRKEWGFEGLAMTDWWANINRRGQAPDKRDFAAMAMAQNDLYMVCADGEKHDDNTLESLEKGELQRAELQRNAANVLKVVLRSNAMKRLAGTANTIEIVGREEAGAVSQEDVPCYQISKELTVDLTGVKTARDSSYSFILDIETPGRFEFTLTASSDAGELAQIPVSVLSMGTVVGTFTWNGTGGKPKSFTGGTYMFSRYTTVRLYFAQGGLDLIDMKFQMTE
ncbi:MAG: glycoside hydrolase family 3 protein [Lachnospiraceae bacterium]|nr:glycoside hydrolase family 3 protein [Lachnospiraceae bacterium]